MPKQFTLIAAIAATTTGILFLLSLPNYTRRLAEPQQEGKRTAKQVKVEIKNFKLTILGSLIVGGGIFCSYVFDL